MLPDRETTENLQRLEGYMKEEPNQSIGKCFANHCRHKHQVVIVYPDWKIRECDEKNG